MNSLIAAILFKHEKAISEHRNQEPGLKSGSVKTLILYQLSASFANEMTIRFKFFIFKSSHHSICQILNNSNPKCLYPWDWETKTNVLRYQILLTSEVLFLQPAKQGE